jgi:class 3 adenylate cyclase
MKWKLETSKERVEKQKKILDDSGITIKRLTREMDFNNLSTTEARLFHGTHLYADIKNFATIVANSTLSRENFKPLHRYLHVARREQRYITQQSFEGEKVQIQAQKFHGILYKPYDNDAKLAWRSVLMGATMIKMMSEALPQAFPDYPTLSPAVGLSLGDALIANIGVHGDRELISVGSVANHAAKIISSAGTVSITESLYSALAEKRQKLFTKNDDGTYRMNSSELKLDEELKSENISWSAEDAVKRMKADIDALPLKDIDSEEAQVLIDLYSLGPSKMKTCSAGAIFADIDGYTAKIDSLMDDDEKLADAVKQLHLFRYELQCVTERDFEGLSVQHQGDRMFAISHLPADVDKAKNDVVELCVSLNSSVELVLNKFFKIFPEEYHIAIGSAFGKTVVIRSGAKCDLDAGCLGTEVLEAENLQLRSTGSQLRISKDLFASIKNDALRGLFKFDQKTDSYLGDDITWEKVEDAEERKAYAAKASVSFNTVASTLSFRNPHEPKQHHQHEIPVKNTRNWGF